MILVALVALGAIPVGAAAQQAPPPSSELDQYVPIFPGAKGDKALGGGGEGDGGGGSQAGANPVPSATLEKLSSLGPGGQAAADFAEGSAPRGGDGGTSGKAGGSGGKADGGSSVGAVVGPGAGGVADGGMGLLLPFLLVAIAVGGILYALRRRGIVGSSGRE